MNKYERINKIIEKLSDFNKLKGCTGDVAHFVGLDGSKCYLQSINNNPLSIVEMYGIEQSKGKFFDSYELSELKLKERETFWQTTNCTIYHGLNGTPDWNNISDYTRDVPKHIRKPKLLYDENGKLLPIFDEDIREKIKFICKKVKSLTKNDLDMPNYIR
eukprot:81503_1